ncbi:MAG: alpha-amylase family protein [Terriglobia bacterium]
MRSIVKLIIILVLCVSASSASGKVMVLWQNGFPTLESQPVPQETLRKALDGMQPEFVSLNELNQIETWGDVELLVLPYGSAVPSQDWSAIKRYLETGGNLLVLGGRPLTIPVWSAGDRFIAGPPETAYSREIGIEQTYEAPLAAGLEFAWKDATLSGGEVRAKRVFVLEGVSRGLGYLQDSAGERVAAPVVATDFASLEGEAEAKLGSRIVMLDFEPEPGYWTSPEAVTVLREAAGYARQGATAFRVEMQNATLLAGEIPQLVVRLTNLRKQRLGEMQSGRVAIELLRDGQVLAAQQVDCGGETVASLVAFEDQKALLPGLYEVHATYEDGGKPRESYRTGFWVRDDALLHSAPHYGVKGDFLTRDGAPFFPFGTNYFTTEHYGWGFHGAGNAWVWERDFADMERHGVSFIRTGVWLDHVEVFDGTTGQVKERFLRNLEAFLLSAARHRIHVNFTFCAFDPQTIMRHPGEESFLTGPGSNPYTDPVALRAQQNYMLSIVRRFKDVPHLSWDLINEPSFSNPKRLWRGNTPNNDPTELAAWRAWLKEKYRQLDALARDWNVTPEELGSFQAISLPAQEDLAHERYGNPRLVRAVDYNLFAQEMFRRWVGKMVAAIRSTGSHQLVDVGQDEGGVSDRVLNQFFADAGVDFTVNHTYWRDDALLWDSVAAKRAGVPNFVGETGYQPVWRPDGEPRYDELTALGLVERKWALGFAAASSGSLQWEWGLGGDFGMKRSDGSNKLWEDVMRAMGKFAAEAAPHALGLKLPEVALVLPQSLQLSVFNSTALEAQQNCVRALYQYARSSAYAVGEYQIQSLGNPKLILLPSPWTLSESTWQAILAKVRDGATLLVTGSFDNDEHFHATERASQLGIDLHHAFLTRRENPISWPGGKGLLSYSGEKTTFLEQALLPHDQTFLEKALGKGRVLIVTLPLELNDNLKVVGDVYRYALQCAHVAEAYSTQTSDPGMLICPTQFEHATLYVLTSESTSPEISFRDSRSGKTLASKLQPGRAALLLVSDKGELLTTYNWK